MSTNGILSYSHSIFIEGLSKDCDSNIVMAAIKDYVENTSSDVPVASVSVFNSLNHFDEGETLSQPKEFYGDCVVEVWFAPSSKLPEKFIFFNASGNTKYEGNRWKP
jgi:hypothetical protein